MPTLILSIGLSGCFPEPDVFPFPEPPTQPVPNTDEGPVTEVFTQQSHGRVDLLWVVDPSSPDSQMLDALLENVPHYLGPLLGTAWDARLGVVIAGGDLAWVDLVAPAPEHALAAALLMGTEKFTTDPSHPLDTTFEALEQVAASRLTLDRQDAPLHTLLLSDLDDPERIASIQVSDFISWYDGLALTPQDWSLSVVAGPALAAHSEAVAAAVGGSVFDVTQLDWPAELSALGEHASGLQREFFLNARPVPQTLTATLPMAVDGSAVLTEVGIGDDLTYSPQRNAIRFPTFLPIAGTDVIVSYEEARP